MKAPLARRSILLRRGWARRLGSLRCRIGGAALALVGHGELGVSVGKRGIGSHGLLVACHRVGHLSALQELVAGIEGEGSLLTVYGRAAQVSSLAAVIGGLGAQFGRVAAELAGLGLISG